MPDAPATGRPSKSVPARRTLAELAAEEAAVMEAMSGRPPMRIPDIAAITGMDGVRVDRTLNRLGRRGRARRVLLDIGSSVGGIARWTLGTAVPDGWREAP